MRKVMLPLFSLVVFAGCGGMSTVGGGASDMVYSAPSRNPMTYERSDSMGINVEAPGMGSLTIRVDQLMELGMTFAPSAGGARVTTVIESLSAQMTNPLSAPVKLTESEIRGAFVVEMDGQGQTAVINVPQVTNESPAFNVTSLAKELLPRLPPRGTRPGGMWTDSTHYAGTGGGGSIDVTWVGTYRMVGDTVVDGRTLTLVRSEAEVTIEVAASMSGMDVTQSMSGPEVGFYLWDSRGGNLVSHEVEREFSGQVRVPISPAPLGLRASQRRTMRMIGG